SVTQQGIRIEQTNAGFLMMIAVRSSDGATDATGLGDFVNRNVIGEIRRIDGVGSAQLFAAPRAMRVWIDPDKMLGLGLTTSDVMNAIRSQNAQVAAGRIGAEPSLQSNRTTASVLVRGQLQSAEEFGAIVLRAHPDGSSVRLRDVARVEIGGESYNFASRLDGQPSAAIGVQLSPTGNAMATSEAVRAKMAELGAFFPAGIEYDIPYDTSPFVAASIEKVFHTLLEAMGLVFLVMFLFLQNFRYTVIPTLVVPVALLGTCAVMFAAGFSINVLTMFAMVLAIGILVDDAIVVVENVERIMAEEGLSPREATRTAMSQITGAIIGITLVLTAVFVPMAFFPGAVGVIYQQFSLTMVVSILFSGFLALTLTPALCASFLKPLKHGHHEKRGFFGWFNRGFARTTNGYVSVVGRTVARAGRMMVIYLALVAGLGWAFLQLPTSFLPNEDQGFLLVDILAPAEASALRTSEVIEQMEEIAAAEEGIDRIVALRGFSFSGSGQNAGLAFLTLDDWSERGPEDSAQAIAGRLNGKFFMDIKDAQLFALSPPAISGLGTTSGFEFRLQDRAGLGQTALAAARGQLFAAAAESGVITGLRVSGMPDAAMVN
ncbi:MAG: MMPL family transporter, partial [Bauldia sp.]